MKTSRYAMLKWLLKAAKAKWKYILVSFVISAGFASMSVATILLLKNNQDVTKELFRICDELDPQIEDLGVEEEKSALTLFAWATNVVGLEYQKSINIVIALRAITSKETGCRHIKNGNVVLSPTRDLGLMQIHLTNAEYNKYKESRVLIKDGIAVHTREGNAVYGAMMFKWKAKRHSQTYRKTSQIPSRDLKRIFKAYNGSGAAAEAYSIDVLKRYKKFLNMLKTKEKIDKIIE